MRKLLLICIIVCIPCSAVLADAPNAHSLNNERLYQAVEKFVQEMIRHFLIKNCGEVMQRAMTKQNVQIFPEIAFQASQRAAVEIFKQDDLKSILWGIFDENTSQAKDEINMGMPQSYIELGIKKRIEQDINILVEDPMFRYVIEAMLNQAVIQQQQIVMMAAAQQQAQLLAIRQQQLMMQQAVMEQILKQLH